MPDALRFSYTPVKNARGEILLRPLIPVTLEYRGRTLTAQGLLDTGADVNVLPYSLGVGLGAVWEEQRTQLQLSGNLANYEARGILISLIVGQLTPTLMAFAWTKTDNVPLIFGQVNFFAQFNVCFFGSQSVFEVQPKTD